MTATPRKPRAFDLPRPDEATPDLPVNRAVVIEDTPDPFPLDRTPGERDEALPAKRRGFGLLSLALSAGGGFIVVMVGNSAIASVRDLIAANPSLGWIAAGLLAIAVLAAAVWAFRELYALRRLARIEGLRERTSAALASRDSQAARAISTDIVALYRQRPETARGRARIEDIGEAIVDARERLAIVEHALLAPLDQQARTLIAASAKRVSVVTALSPRALIDILFVGAESLRLIRRLAELYGGRPGFFGGLGLVRRVLGHLALTGGVAMGDEVLQQVVGQGLAARLSAKLGEGVLNGLLTARVGLSALAACRPLPFTVETAPTVRDVAGALWSKDGS